MQTTYYTRSIGNIWANSASAREAGHRTDAILEELANDDDLDDGEREKLRSEAIREHDDHVPMMSLG